jgi:hypothetical protein
MSNTKEIVNLTGRRIHILEADGKVGVVTFENNGLARIKPTYRDTEVIVDEGCDAYIQLVAYAPNYPNIEGLPEDTEENRQKLFIVNQEVAEHPETRHLYNLCYPVKPVETTALGEKVIGHYALCVRSPSYRV